MRNFTLFTKILLTLSFLLLTAFGFGQSQTYAGTGTFVVPTGVTSLTVEAWGAGGRGSSRNNGTSGAGGGGGAYAQKIIAVTAGTNYTVTVGTGSTSTAAGGDSWFGTATTVLAKGGSSAADNSLVGGTGGSAAASIGTFTNSGGAGATVVVSTFGGGGGSSGGTSSTTGTGTTALTATGAIAPTGGGNGGNGKAGGSNGSGVVGVIPGGGGGGCYRVSGTQIGGAGANGWVKISWTAPQLYTLFYEDFDAGSNGWTDQTATNVNGSWLLTTAFPSLTINEIGENSFWRINNYNDYANNATIEIISKEYDFTGFQNLSFDIDIRRDTEKDVDGMRILYSINNAAYLQLGANGTGDNWYNSTTVSALGSNGWSDNNVDTTNPLGFGPANRFFRASTPLNDAVFKNQSKVRFKIQFKSNNSNTDDGVAFDNVSVKGEPIVAIVASPVAPAKVNQNLSLWFKTNAGIAVTDGTALTTWDDQAYDTTRSDLVNQESVKALATDAPTYRDNATKNINFNPVADFSLTTVDYMKGKGGLYSQDYFVVVYSNDVVDNSTGANGRQIPLGGKTSHDQFHEDPTGLGLGATSSRYTDEVISHAIGSFAGANATDAIPGTDSYGRAYTSTTQSFSEPLIINVKNNSTSTQTEIYKNGIKIDNTTAKTGTGGDVTPLNFSDYYDLPFYLGTGRSGISGRTNSCLNGRLSEVVVYTAPNSALNQQKIQSYLGLKYGITLHATTGSLATTRLNDVNYIDSAGNIIWDTAANSGFDYDITGIGKDDDSQLNQKQSKSVNPHTSTAFDDDITIGLTDIATTNNLNTNTFGINKNFLCWGNNDGSLNAQPAVTVNISSGITSPSALTTNVDFISIGRTWKVVETGGNMPATKVSIPTTMLTNTITPPGDFLMFISTTPTFSPTADYRVMTVNGSNLETTYDFDGTKYITFGYAPERTFVRCINFDGTNDYLDAGKVLDLNTSFTVSAWINRDATTLDKSILSKKDAAFTSGYDFKINSTGKVEMSWKNGTTQTITSNATIPSGIWHNVGVIYDGTNAKLYIDGVLDKTVALSNVLAASTQSFLIGAADGLSTATTAFFKGSIDEVRVWKVALTEAQFRYVMNQEILKNSTLTNGVTIPNTITLNDISSILWTNLNAYYPMSTYAYTNAKDVSGYGYTAALRNLTTVDRQTAPLPYESQASGLWQTSGTWLNNTVQDLPNSMSIVTPSVPVNWNIVVATHDITSEGDKTVLGLYVGVTPLGVTTASKLTATTASPSQTTGSKIEVSHYLKLNGKLDLVGRSQLVQSLGSDLEITSSGSVERDQQGQSNKYNYNYWSSPVGTLSTTANNVAYTVGGVLKDGTTPATPAAITWVTGNDGSPTTPISLASKWIFKFDNAINDYANWQRIYETGTVPVGQGFTLKGSGAASATQNLTFVGKPNNGNITSTVGAAQLLLVGNPYPSALDASAFIADNATSIDTTTPASTDGALYFWEHYAANNSHNLSAYQGGYAVRNAASGVPPSSVGVDFINTSGATTRLAPNRYIPVGQGFFVIGDADGGTVTFKNSQRAFVKEDNAASQITYRIPTKPKGLDHWTDTTDDITAKDTYKRVRLGFNNRNEIFHRQVVVAFMDERANGEINPGYDAENIDDVPNDMFLINSDKELIIEGEGYFDETASYPIGVRSDSEGVVTFIVDGLENFDANQPVFIYDDETQTYHDIRTEPYEVTLPEGENTTRFALRFTDKALGLLDNNPDDIKVSYARASSILSINNNITAITVEKVILYNLLGQSLATYKVENQEQSNIKIPIKGMPAGVYIAKVKTSKGVLNKKFIVK
ncbi:LamG-like jellyroll fold domain-containing protein [Flavobacterium restrictum]|uniref:T9SS type A sorting domain-containing protein n=1 Tax=Flavobacterium restrictum TaxID=2594428 RepID=A0A553E6T3_9FLAO|nr:LamG-like jellyroll fold domain-containing protein [Flavobacterium restrictum]TRX40768.1 T9SS type A sorting domain-containing protein [Flavobacterium restrictum]